MNVRKFHFKRDQVGLLLDLDEFVVAWAGPSGTRIVLRTGQEFCVKEDLTTIERYLGEGR